MDISGICGCESQRVKMERVEIEYLSPGEVLIGQADGSFIRRSVFEVATDPAKAGEKEYAVFECLRRSALVRCQPHES